MINMKIAEARELKKGTLVKWNLGQGWYQTGTFIKLTKVIKLGSATFGDLKKGDFDFNKGKEVLEALVEYQDEKGRTKTELINVRKLRTKGEK